MIDMWGFLKRKNISENNLWEALNKNKSKASKVLKDKSKAKILGEQVFQKSNLLSSIPLIGSLIFEIKDITNMVLDYAHGNYKKVPLPTMLAFAAALIYFVSPIDLIPDVIPVLGYIDDAAIFKLVMKAFHLDLDRYRNWKEE